MYFNIGCPFRY